MSLIIGIKESNRVILACDSQITSGGVRRVNSVVSNYKVWHPDQKDDLLMGGVGSLREKNVLHATKELINKVDYLEGTIDYEYVVNHLVPKIQTRLKESGCISEKDTPIKTSSRLVFAYKEKLFEIDTDGATMEIDEYTAIGSGANEALASLHTTTDVDPNTRIKVAMKAACINDIYVSDPIIVSDTLDGTYKKLNLEEEK